MLVSIGVILDEDFVRTQSLIICKVRNLVMSGLAYLQFWIEGSSQHVSDGRMHSALNIQSTSWEWIYARSAWIHHPFKKRLIKAILNSILQCHLRLIDMCPVDYLVERSPKRSHEITSAVKDPL